MPDSGLASNSPQFVSLIIISYYLIIISSTKSSRNKVFRSLCTVLKLFLCTLNPSSSELFRIYLPWDITLKISRPQQNLALRFSPPNFVSELLILPPGPFPICFLLMYFKQPFTATMSDLVTVVSRGELMPDGENSWQCHSKCSALHVSFDSVLICI